MAAVLALIMLPVIAAVGFFIGAVHTHASISAAIAMTMFVALASFVLISAFRMAWQADHELE